MLPIHRILHPTDFSDRSDNAFQVACALARDHNATLIVLHVQPSSQIFSSEAFNTTAIGGIDSPQRRLRTVQPFDPAVKIEHKLVEGDPATEILRVAHESDCDLIVMGTHGWTGLSRLLMGSVAAEVVRKATCPVLTVKTPFVTAETPASLPKSEVAHA
jgi:nucleotide-binding universal stress UspA family protein